MKRGHLLIEQFPEDYGTRTDYAGSTTAVLGDVVEHFEAKEYWGYIKAKYPGTNHKADEWVGVEEIHGKPVVIPADFHFDWLKKYYEFRGSDELRFSTGMGLLLMGLERIKPGKLILAGFDAIADPDPDNDHDSVQFSPDIPRKRYDWVNNPPHDYRVEHEFLFGPVQQAYETLITVMP